MKTILCPTDFSSVAQNALLYATEFAKRSGAKLILFHTEFFPESDLKENNKELINFPKEYIPELKEKFESLMVQLKLTFPEVNFSYIVEEGLVAENIALYANKNNIDFIIMGTSGASGWEALFIGSNAVNVMEKANCPTLIIPDKVEFSSIKHFVYATDLLDNEDDVINEILKITRLFDAQLELLHLRTNDALELVNSEISLNSLVKKHADANIIPRIINTNDSIEGIEKYAKQKADILVMANRKKNILERLFSRNRTEKLAYKTEVPLLIMRKS